ncbi:MAG: LppP/LprE family lipoprotein, partial [Propionibacteriaceae bacterium]|nr:LppP/LprE family lipoprotein [Propionibacteriaceae bacterium]
MVRRRRTILAVGILTTLLTACGSTPAAEEPTVTTATSTRGECLSGDLADSEFGPHLGSSVIRTDSGEYFHFGVADNAYDSCRDLSWIVLDGQIVDRAGAGLRPSGTVIFFHGTRLADENQPRLYQGVESVRRQGETGATVTWRHEQPPHASEDTVSLTGTRLTDITHTTPEQRRADVPVIDLHSPPIESGSGVPPHGNIHGGPFDAVLPAGRYRIPLTEGHDLLCELDGIIDCYRDLGTPRGDDPSTEHVTVTPDGPVTGTDQPPAG